MTKEDLIDEVLGILRNMPQDEAIEVICDCDVDYIISKMESDDEEEE